MAKLEINDALNRVRQDIGTMASRSNGTTSGLSGLLGNTGSNATLNPSEAKTKIEKAKYGDSAVTDVKQPEPRGGSLPGTPETLEPPNASSGAQQGAASKTEQPTFSAKTQMPEYQTLDYAKRLEELGGGKYTPSENVTAAQDYLNSIISSKPGAYQSRYGDQLDELYNKIMNREDFSYDLNGDALYQQYKDRYIAQGQSAMRDATAQASALTGGYGNSYAATAGNIAYQNYLQQLNDVVPELYQQAYQRYLQEGEDLQNQYAITQAADEAAYGRWRDSYNDWINDRAYAQAAYESAYGQDYKDYTNRLNNAMTMMGMEQSDLTQKNANAFSKYMNDIGDERADYEYDRDAARQDALLQQQYAREDALTADERKYNQSLIESERDYNDALTNQKYYRDLVASIAGKGKLPSQSLLGIAGLTTAEAESLAKAYGYKGSGYGGSSGSTSGSSSSGKGKTTASSGNDTNGSSGVSYDDLLNWATGGQNYANWNVGWNNSGLSRDEYDSSRRKNYAK